ncbi:alanine racemase [Acetohalobium arabaticum]|uniref:Alanine racemase n=1 Tax=Acetohalobium arabaticum (strain ATCC 49924 / DSM 5501 / Z-7288) TaxID=574087 RepID=D9QQZ6_ACEAZ|nr:alanine racemase [Acetohalobium arabaticum]ADL12937.1 alanine racemase [Acetohalobium arabaticum DSM 5501]
MGNEFNRPVWVEVNLENIRFNLKQIRARVSADTLVMAVVKADAYGHGAVPVARAAVEAGADRLAVGLPEEGVQLRNAGFEVPIQILGEVLPEQIPLLAKYGLIPTVSKLETAVELERINAQLESRQKIHLKVDTGMGRLGVKPDEVVGFAQKLSSFPHLELEGLLTHFATADEADKEYTRQQWQKFNYAIECLEAAGIRIPVKHCANSAAIIDLPEMELDLVRAGIMLYGLRPSDEVGDSLQLKSVLNWKARIVYLKEVDKGCGISYGATYTTADKAEIATIPLGYADGYFRALSNKGDVLINGRRAPIRGRVCMDQFMVDVTEIPGVSVGDEVILIGKQDDKEVTAMELADLVGTINYEIISKITKRVPRIYVN